MPQALFYLELDQGGGALGIGQNSKIRRAN
jgi:hypothetical protein